MPFYHTEYNKYILWFSFDKNFTVIDLRTHSLAILTVRQNHSPMYVTSIFLPGTFLFENPCMNVYICIFLFPCHIMHYVKVTMLCSIIVW